MGRATQGVRLINLKGNDSIAAVAKVMREDEEEVDSTEEQTEEGATEINTSKTDESASETQEEE
jgi:DNA gyrase subunit A